MVLFGNNGKKARLIGTALLVITFVAGALAGAAVIRVVSAEKPVAKQSGEPRSMRGGARRLLLDEQFTKQLGLTDAQRSEVRAILDRRDAEAKKMWSEFEPRLHEFGKAVQQEIQNVLTPEQQSKLDAAIEQRRAAWRQRCRGDSATATQSQEKKL